MIIKTRETVLQGLQESPELHQHSFTALTACCTIGGAVDHELWELHAIVLERPANPGVCNVASGPCACRGWH